MALSFHQSYITLGANRAAPPIPVPNAGPFRRRGTAAPAASHPLRHLSRASNRPTGEGTAPGLQFQRLSVDGDPRGMLGRTQSPARDVVRTDLPTEPGPGRHTARF